MPDLNEFYGSDRGRATKVRDGYIAYVRVYRRDRPDSSVKEVSGEGGTATAAINRATAEAKRWANLAGEPEGWNSNSN